MSERVSKSELVGKITTMLEVEFIATVIAFGATVSAAWFREQCL
jgi:hypothetical protein